MQADDFSSRSLILVGHLLLLVGASLQDPIPISLHNHNGRGDIVQLWPAAGAYSEHSDRPGVMRNALKPNAPNRWVHYRDRRGKFVIPYVITGQFSESEQQIIHGAMKAIRKNSCVRFRKRRNEADFVSIENERGEGCYTMVGRARGKNVVMLETNEMATCLLHETVIHELFHTIGLWHEQMRYDRDNYIKVHYENIPSSFHVQFKKIPPFQSTTYNVKYDYKSVMHYAKDAFALVPGEITMQTVDKNAQDVIGNAKDASPSDYIKVCSIYQCPDCMGQPFQMGESVADKKVVGENASGTGLPSSLQPSIGFVTGKNGNVGDIGDGINKRITDLFKRLVGHFAHFRQPGALHPAFPAHRPASFHPIITISQTFPVSLTALNNENKVLAVNLPHHGISVHIQDNGETINPQVNTTPDTAKKESKTVESYSGSSDSTESSSESSPGDEERLPLSTFLLASAPHDFNFNVNPANEEGSSEWLQFSGADDEDGWQ